LDSSLSITLSLSALLQVPEVYKDSGLVNFSKYRAMAHLLLSLHTADWIGFFFDPIDPIQFFLQKHLAVLSEEDLTAASEKIQKRKGGEKLPGDGSKGAKDKQKEKEKEPEGKEKRKSTDKLAAKKAAVINPEKKITESRSETLKRVHGSIVFHFVVVVMLFYLTVAFFPALAGELIAKWDRPLSQLSVHADVPRMVNKVLVVNKKTGPPTVWPLTEEMAPSSLTSIRGFFESLHRCACPSI